MLVLRRKPGERIVIGESIVVVVLSATPFGVSLGIEAPKSVAVDRAEVRKPTAPTRPVNPAK